MATALRKAVRCIVSFLSLTLGWLAIYGYLNVVGKLERTEINIYLGRLGISAVFFLCIMIAALLMFVAENVRTVQKIWYVGVLCVHYCGYLSLVFLGSGAIIPLVQMGVFVLSAVVLLILGMMSIFTAIRK